MDSLQAKGFIVDYIRNTLETALNAKRAIDNARKSGDGVEYYSGYSQAYYEVIDLIKQLAIAFDIDLSELGLDNIDPDKDLL